MDEFEDVAIVARPPMTSTADANAHSRTRSAIGKAVSRVHRAANVALRADTLTRRLCPLGVLSLVAVAMGAFARHVRRDGLVPETFSAEGEVRFSREQIRELTILVHEATPDALQ